MTHAVSGAVTGGFAVLLVAMILCLALEEKIHAKKSVIVAVFAVACLLLGAMLDLLPFEAMEVVVGEEHIHLPIYIPAIDWANPSATRARARCRRPRRDRHGSRGAE